MKKLNTERKIERYIKHLFGLDVKVKFKHHFWGGYSALCYRECKLIEIQKSMTKYYDFMIALIWHEVGHVFTAKPHKNYCLSVKNEVNAQIWAFKTAKKRKYNRVYKILMDDFKNCNGWKRHNYRRARSIILNKLKRRDFSLMK